MGTPLVLTGTVVPSNATNKTITWSVKDSGSTGANIAGNTLTATAIGTAVVTAKVAGSSGDFTKDFIISVVESDKISLGGATITLGGEPFAYTGDAILPVIASVEVGGVLVGAGEYTVEYFANTDVGTATVIITAAPGGNYTGSASTTFIITKGVGAAVSGAPSVSERTLDSITVNTVSVSGLNPGAQSVEYAITESASEAMPDDLSWQAGTLFTGLNHTTTYYIWVRTAENNNYNAGAAERSNEITTMSIAEWIIFLIDNTDMKDENSVNDTVDKIKDLDTDDVAAAGEDPDVAKRLEELEDAYNKHNDILVEAVVDPVLAAALGFDGSAITITIIGAGMNATDGPVTLTLSGPKNPGIVVDPIYTNVIRFSMTLEGTGINASALDVPVTIEMPMPKGVNPLDLLLLHFYDDGETYNIIVPQILNGGTRISFTLTRFSEFAFVTAATENPEDPDDPTNPTDTFEISVSPTTLAFGSQAFGYSQRPVQTVTITNTGTGTVTLNNLPSVANWTLVPEAYWGTAMTAGQTRTFTIRPNNFLNAGSYNPTIMITGNDGASVQIRPTFTVYAQPAIESFVIRLYQNVHGRNHDTGGLQYWAASLRSGTTGASVAHGFFFSNEFKNRKDIDNDRFLDILYRTLMDRVPDAGGIAYWGAKMRAGLPREDVFAGFVHSPEYTKICGSYGIVRGDYTPPRGGMARVFATRLYRTTLEREPELGGLNYWHNALASGSVTGAKAAYGFIFSPEMNNRNLKDEEFLEILYNALMGRDSEAGGKAFWLNQLRTGTTRYSAFAGFVYSVEFDRICRDHGIIRGTP